MAFLKTKVDMSVVYSLTLYSYLKLKVCVFETKVMCMLQTQSVTLFFLYYYWPHELESGNTYNKE